MTESHVEPTEGSREPRRWRYLIDIVALVAVTFVLDAVLSAFIPVPINLQKGFVFDAIGKMLLIGVAWGLIRLRGETLADIGLKRPASWMRTFMIGIGFAAIVFVAMYARGSLHALSKARFLVQRTLTKMHSASRLLARLAF